jgi:hypothetical protein
MNSSAARNWLVLSLVLAFAMVAGIGYVVYQGTGRTDAARMEGLVKEFEAAGIPVDEPSQPEKESPLGRALLAVWGGTGARFRDAGRGGAFAEAYQKPDRPALARYRTQYMRDLAWLEATMKLPGEILIEQENGEFSPSVTDLAAFQFALSRLVRLHVRAGDRAGAERTLRVWDALIRRMETGRTMDYWHASTIYRSRWQAAVLDAVSGFGGTKDPMVRWVTQAEPMRELTPGERLRIFYWDLMDQAEHSRQSHLLGLVRVGSLRWVDEGFERPYGNSLPVDRGMAIILEELKPLLAMLDEKGEPRDKAAFNRAFEEALVRARERGGQGVSARVVTNFLEESYLPWTMVQSHRQRSQELNRITLELGRWIERNRKAPESWSETGIDPVVGTTRERIRMERSDEQVALVIDDSMVRAWSLSGIRR